MDQWSRLVVGVVVLVVVVVVVIVGVVLVNVSAYRGWRNGGPPDR